MDSGEHSQRRRIVGFLASTFAMIVYCLLLGWALASATNSPTVAFGSFGFAAIVGVWALYLRFFRKWTPETVSEFRSKGTRLFVRASAAIGIATLMFIFYLMLRNN